MKNQHKETVTMQSTPKRKPGRPRRNEIETRLEAYQKLDSQILADHETYLEIDVSTPLLPKQTMLVDKVDYERFKSMLVGRFTARTSGFANAIIAGMNTRNKHGEFNISASYVHSMICKGNGYLWHRNGNMLDNRRKNLETDIPLQTSTVGLGERKSELCDDKPHVFIGLNSLELTDWA